MTDPLPPVSPTVSHLLGEMTWLLSQSAIHRALAIGDLEWLVMPALVTEQFYLFRDGQQPVGLALWVRTDAEGEAKLGRGILQPENRLRLEDWSSGDRIWLVDLVAPFATTENRQREIMLADLIAGPLKGCAFGMHVTAPDGARRAQMVSADASDRLQEVVRQAIEQAEEKTR